MEAFKVKFAFEIDFDNQHTAEIIFNTVTVDEELSPGKAKETVKLEGSLLKVTIETVDMRQMRLSLKGFLDSVILAQKTIVLFDNDEWNKV
ncbi:hypothetical protein AKO1_002747 [Acrasis kona]|uniref:Uncharacterized protein n=1 Tax=Acrasis kona TaxID=1008807 RepID=A0AAW2Z4X1_9EUKA